MSDANLVRVRELALAIAGATEQILHALQIHRQAFPHYEQGSLAARALLVDCKDLSRNCAILAEWLIALDELLRPDIAFAIDCSAATLENPKFSPSSTSTAIELARTLLAEVGGQLLPLVGNIEFDGFDPLLPQFWRSLTGLEKPFAAKCVSVAGEVPTMDFAAIKNQIKAEIAKANTASQTLASTAVLQQVSKVTSRKLIRRSDLWKALRIDSSTINTRIKNNGHPSPINPQDKNQVFDLEEVNKWLKSNGFPQIEH
jgi:hypothetical protein